MNPILPPIEQVIDLLTDAVCIVDGNGYLLFVNASFERMLGYTAAEAVGRRTFDYLHPDDLDATMKQVETIMAGHTQRHFRNRYLHKEGHMVDIQWSAKWHPEYGVRIAVGREITELRQAERQIEHMANHDALTGLPNRHYLQNQIARACEHTRVSGEAFALLYIDMDGFKAVNDRWGHDGGDKLLHEVAERLKHARRSGDTAARVGGDEFVVLLPGCSDRAIARKIAEIVRQKLRVPYDTQWGQAQLDASVGVAICPEDGNDPASLLAHADRNMYVVKRTR